VVTVARGNKNVSVNEIGKAGRAEITGKPRGIGERSVPIIGRATEKNILLMPKEIRLNLSCEKGYGRWVCKKESIFWK